MIGRVSEQVVPGKRRRHPPTVRRVMVLEAARDCIVKVGMAQTTARVIAARCGIAVGTLTYHFPSLDELLVEALRQSSHDFTDQVLAQVREQGSAEERLLVLIDTAMPDRPAAARNWRLWLEYWARAIHHPEIAGLHNERYDAWRGAFAETIAAGVASGEFAAVDAASEARRLVGLLDGLCLQLLVGDTAVPVEAVRELLHEAVRLLRAARS